MIKKNDIEKYVDVNIIKKSKFKSTSIYPNMFKYNIFQESKKAQKHIFLPEVKEKRILYAASMFLYKKLGKLTLIGNTQKIKEDIINLGLYWDDNRAKIIYPKNSSYYEEFVDTLFFLRKDKGIKFNEAKILVIPTNEEL